jgi:hypothetical protein
MSLPRKSVSAVTAGSAPQFRRRQFSGVSGAPNAASVAKPLPQQRFTHEAPSAEGGTLSGSYPVTVTKPPIDIAATARAFQSLVSSMPWNMAWRALI